MEQKILHTPAAIAQILLQVGEYKAKRAGLSTFLMGILAGIFLAFGSVAYLTVVGFTTDAGLGKFLGGAIFPVGLMLIVIAGSDLFTGNNLMTMGMLEKKYSFGLMMKNWALVWIGNLIGSLFIVFLVTQSGLFGTPDKLLKSGEFVIKLAEKKMHLDFMSAVYRGILCNLVVALAVLVATAAKDGISKVWIIWFPIAAFVIAGYEHVVANMVYIPTAIALGANISWGAMFVSNFLPVTIGNIIGGGVILPGLYWYLYIREPKMKELKASESNK